MIPSAKLHFATLMLIISAAACTVLSLLVLTYKIFPTAKLYPMKDDLNVLYFSRSFPQYHRLQISKLLLLFIAISSFQTVSFSFFFFFFFFVCVCDVKKQEEKNTQLFTFCFNLHSL